MINKKRFVLIFFVSILTLMNYKIVNASRTTFIQEDISPFFISFQVKMEKWRDVDHLIPKYSTFQVIDYETGASFSVQRRAGSKHADVQPLTKKDTEIFKKIYNGRWSWNRRAALVLINDQLIAASMHGMPHGAGALINGFPGHFCIHFFESTTHSSNVPDFDHYLMILRSAGKLDEYLDKINSHDTANVLFTALNNNDFNLIKSVVVIEKKDMGELLKLTNNVEGIRWRIDNVNDVGSELVSFSLPVEVKIHIKDKGLLRKNLELQVMRNSPFERWRIDSSSLLRLFE
ncbi:hypothetical protein [Calidifontibacillus oryziterrae]|uniref:hypothetical protein n=1 Tax=Calidifontibacillus oryziterrae TaxID=1191699 RepID=UPI0002D2BE0D|nr:hypothetical protein [Calidifontibacillus oryziterrae]